MSKLRPLGYNLVSILLSMIYSWIVSCRNVIYDSYPCIVKKTGIHTVSVGGIHAGGTGKTPMVHYIGQQFVKNDYLVAFLSRGYGRKKKGTVIVPPNKQKDWKEIGDEPAFLHQSLPETWLAIGADRYKSACVLKSPFSKSKSTLILDDGFQHRKIFRNKNIVCLPPDPFNDSIIPAGTLREPLSSIKRADCVCLVGLTNERSILEKSKQKLQQLYKKLKIFIVFQTGEYWINFGTREQSKVPPLKKPVVLSGIARPHRFLKLLQNNNVIPCKTVCYEDHHIYAPHEVTSWITPESDGILTTEKDIMRLSSINLVNRQNIWYLKIKLSFSDQVSEQKFLSWLLSW